MAKLKALHQIERRNGRGELESIAAGKPFEAEGDELDYYLRTRAAVRVAGTSKVSTEGDPDKDVAKMNKTQLVALATQLELHEPESLTVAQLKTAIAEEQAKRAAAVNTDTDPLS
ncbi:hypothetical protein D3C87_559400 [compost metagenome]